MKEDSDIVELVLEYLQGTSSADRRAELEAMIEADEEFRELVSLLEEMLAAGDSMRSLPLSEPASQLAKELFADFKKDLKYRRIRHGVRVYDSKCLPKPDGVRPAVVETRELKFKLADWEIELSLHPVTADSYELIGRIVGMKRGRDVKVTLKNRATSMTAMADKFYVFRFDRVPAKNYQMLIKDSTKTLGVIRLEL
jgi:hypothetical protein